MFAGMGLMTEWYDENVSVAVMWGACPIVNESYLGELYTEENVRFLLDNGIYVFAGPNWERDQALIMEKGP